MRDEARGPSQLVLLHLSKALELLRKRLSAPDEALKISDSTMLAVMTLAIQARMAAEYDSAKSHMRGLRKMVTIRGGITALTSRTKLAMEIAK